MTGKSNDKASFESLRAELVSRLELDKLVVNEERYEIAHRDAVSFSLGIHGSTMKLFKRIDAGLKPTEAERIKTALTGIFLDVGCVAQSELEVALAEAAINQGSEKR